MGEHNFILSEHLYIRFAYVFHTLNTKNTNIFEFFQSIGFLFKKDCTNIDGSIYLEQIIQKGVDYYILYKNFSIVELYKTKILNYKELIELYYYINAVNQVLLGSTDKFYV
jgi:hypothetical protein